jgi:hypothetical protein
VQIDVLQTRKGPSGCCDGAEDPVDFCGFRGRHEVERRPAEDILGRIAKDIRDRPVAEGVSAVRIHLPNPVARDLHKDSIPQFALVQDGCGALRVGDVVDVIPLHDAAFPLRSSSVYFSANADCPMAVGVRKLYWR